MMVLGRESPRARQEWKVKMSAGICDLCAARDEKAQRTSLVHDMYTQCVLGAGSEIVRTIE